MIEKRESQLLTGNSDLVSMAEVAYRCGISPHTVYAWIRRGKLRFVRVGERAIRIPRVKLDRLLAEGPGGRA